MRKPGHLLLVPLSLVLAIGSLGLVYGVVNVSRCWPKTSGTVGVEGLRAPVWAREVLPHVNSLHRRASVGEGD